MQRAAREHLVEHQHQHRERERPIFVSGCATVSPEQAERDALILEAARKCDGQARTVRVTGVDQYGRLKAEYQSPADWRIFSDCYQNELRRALSLGLIEPNGDKVLSVTPEGYQAADVLRSGK